MPSYDLRCQSCDHGFEVFRQGFLRDEDRTCPECDTTHAKQLLTGFVTARPQRVTAGGGGGGCGNGGCGCGH